MDVRCCKCKKEYDLASNIFEYDKDTNCPILICPHCGFKHAINFMPFENKIEDLKKVEKLELGDPALVVLGASRIANASRQDQSGIDDGEVVDGEAWDVSTYKYEHKSKLITDQGEEIPRSVSFSYDGTKMYILGTSMQTVFQYTLSPAWDISTATYSGKSKLISAQGEVQPYVEFSFDGTKMYVIGTTLDTIWQYTLSTAWDVSTATYADKNKLITDQGETTPRSVSFSSDGSKMYILGSVMDTVYQYTLSPVWDVSTATYADKSVLIDGQGETIPRGLTFSFDGSKMYIVGTTMDTVYQYTLSTAWDVSTASYSEKSKLISDQGETGPNDVSFSSDGSKMYIVGMTMDTVFQYTITTDWVKTNDFILATRVYTSKGPIARAYKLRWRDVTVEGVFADISDTGEITYSAVTDLIDGGDLLLEEKICGAQSGYSWQDGLESEGDNLLPDIDTYSLADEYYTEFQWALDCNGAEDEHEYEFELWDVTEGVSIGTCLASITMAISVVAGLSMKWNGRTISKWNGVVINKLNGVD